MNKVEAIIRPAKLKDVKEALAEVGLIGLNVVNVTGRGAQRGVTPGWFARSWPVRDKYAAKGRA